SPSSVALDVALTASGMLLGTPAYMAPEQLSREPADARSDQFSFCVALYEALCGTRPFVAEDTDALRTAILAHRVERPARSVPGALVRIVERGLRATPDQRWPSMDALLDALERAPWLRRRRWLGAAAAALLLATPAVVVTVSRHQRVRACTIHA